MTQNHKQLEYSHVVLEGSAYEVGRMQGEFVANFPEWKAFFASGAASVPEREAAGALELFDKYCPGLNEEIHGFADALQLPPAHIVYYAQTYLMKPGCSHMVVLPSVSANGHLLVGRNFDFSDSMDDFRLCTTRIEGKAAHIGFSVILFGRNDGMNEHGLSVTMSAAGMPVGVEQGMQPPMQNGFQFWALVRMLLENCATVEEALTLIEDFPLCCNVNLLLAHKDGNAALVEISGAHHAFRTIDASTLEQFLYSTNHLTLPEMIPHIPVEVRNSQVRSQRIAERLQQAAPQITSETLRSLLSDPYPDGLCCHYYGEFFGCLHSEIFDLTAGSVEVCFGSPRENAWHRFEVNGAQQSAQYSAALPQERTEPGFWEQIQIGG